MSKNFVSYNDIETIIEKIKLELDKKAVVVAITQEDYDALTEEEQNNGTIYFIIDYNEISGGGITTNFVIKGYYNSEDGKFYNEPSFSTETAKSANYLYIDLAKNIIYIYDSTIESFSALGGGRDDSVTKISMNGEELTVTDGEVDLGTVLTEHQDISGKQDKSTAVKYNGSSAVGAATKGIYVDASGNATAMTYELNRSVPADAKFTDTTYSKATTSDDGLMSKEDKAKLDGLSDIASSGSYNDLEDKPTIPTVNNGTLTIQKNGTNVQTFTANQSENATANITVPTKVSELTNDSGFTSNTGTVTSVKVGTTSYDPSNGVVSLPAYPVNTNTTYTITQDATDGHKFTLAGSDGSSKTITIPDNNTTYTLSSLGIGNVKNLDQSKAIKSITRSGTTFTYTCLDGTTGTFTQQDNNTWTAMVGATASANGSAGYVPAPPSDGYNTKFLRADGTWNDPNIIQIKSLEVRRVGTEINVNDVEQAIYEVFWPNLYGDRTWNMYDQNNQFMDGVKDYFPPKGAGFCVTTLEDFSDINIIDVHGVWENNGFKYPLFNSKIETYFYSPASMIQIYVKNLTDENIDRGNFYLWIRFYADKNN